MADENKPAFYPRVGNIKAKNFRSAQPAPFVDDPRAMDLPQFGDADLGVPNKANLEMSRRIAERDASLKRQIDADTSPLEKAAGALQAVRFMGSALTQSINSLPTRMAHGDEAAEKFMRDRIYQPTQPKALEYAQDVGDFLEKLETEYKIPPVATGEVLGFAPLIQAGIADAAKKGTGAAVRGGMALERKMEPVVRGALERGGLPREMAMAMGQGTQSNVIKPVGGNWIPNEVENAVKHLKRKTPAGSDVTDILRQMKERYTPEAIAGMQEGSRNNILENIAMLERDVALNNWVDSNLTNYLKKQLGTEKDPVRLLADQGITHYSGQGAMRNALDTSYDQFAQNRKLRKIMGMPEEPMAKGPMGRIWEEGIDNLLDQGNMVTAKQLKGGNLWRDNPWLQNLPPDTTLYRLDKPSVEDMNLQHIMDVLREDLVSGRIKPEDVKNISMDRAVRRAHEYNLEMAEKLKDAKAKKLEQMTVYKDYPEQGYRWVQLEKPGDFAAESDAMGHSVRGYEPPKGHPDWVEGSGDRGNPSYGLGGWEAIKSGKAKVYSLVDKNGEPHVTIEVGESGVPSWAEIKAQGGDPLAMNKEAKRRMGITDDNERDVVKNADGDKRYELNRQLEKHFLDIYREQFGDLPSQIHQIKGKGNARPVEKYDPFTQQFVLGNNWTDVYDLKNTGLKTIDEAFPRYEDAKFFANAYPNKKYVTQADIDAHNLQVNQDLINEYANHRLMPDPESKATFGRTEPMTVRELAELSFPGDIEKQANMIRGALQGQGGILPPLEGLKRGGVVVSKNPDTMMLELNNKRMKKGGSEDDTDLTKPFFGGVGTKKYAAAKKRAEQADVNTLKDPRTYAAVMGLLGEAPDQMGFSVAHPDYQGIKDVAEPTFYAGTALGVAPLAKALKAPTMALGRAGEKYAEKVVPQIMERGGIGADILGGLAQGSQSRVIKPTGGNWFGDTVDDALKSLRSKVTTENFANYTPEQVEQMVGSERIKRNDAINKWIDSNLTNYIKKQMATPDDPVRKLAEEGIVHFPVAEDPRYWARKGESARKDLGGTEMAKSDLAKQWENRSDSTINRETAKMNLDMMNSSGMYSDKDEWLKKLAPETPIYSGNRLMYPPDLGFDHIVDVLKQDVAEGRIRPEQLNKVSMEQAVRRTFEFDQEMARKMREAALKQQEGFPVHKEYPEGYKWIELTNPKTVPEGYTLPEGMKLDTIDHPRYGILHTVSDPKGITQIEATDSPESALLRFYNRKGGEGYKALEDALTYEGNTMGHCVGGYCPDVAAGRSRIFSLRDAKGEPHVTVEVRPKSSENYSLPVESWFESQPQEVKNAINEAGYKGYNVRYSPQYKEALSAMPPDIIQIKGKQNAKPKEDYLPYVQDFVRGGNWSDVGDFKNTGFEWHTTGPRGIFMQDDVKALEQAGHKVPKYLTTAEKDDLARKLYEMQTGNDYDTGLPKAKPNPDVPPAEGMKRGGKVSISHNPDTMMLELNNKHMKEGGSEADTKPYFGGAGTKKYAAAKKRAELGDVNLLKDPKTYAAVAGLLGEAPDEMGFSVMHPDYQNIKKVADPAFYAGTALGVAPVANAFKAPTMALGRAGEKYAEKVVPQIMERGGLGADILSGLAQGTRSNLDVWHGSPHKFPPTAKNPLGEFDPTKMGTGEGSQAYGFGHYTAEAKDVAKTYQPRSPQYEEKLLGLYDKAQRQKNYPMMEVLEDAMLHRDPEEILAKFANTEDGYTPQHIKAANDFAKWYEKNPPEVGGLYKVDLSDEAIAKMLDYDKPWKQQPKNVQDAINIDKLLKYYNTEDLPISQVLYHANQNMSPAQFSEFLRSKGIPGVKYLDEKSRAAGEGTRNFVVFPGEEDALTILERKKSGGKVSISKNHDTMMLELNQQKMKNGVPAYSGAGAIIKQGLKASKPELLKASEALGKIEGRPLVITQADRTKVGGGYLGGPGFSSLQLTEPEYRAAEAAWGVKTPGVAKMILGGGKKAGENPVYTTMIGSPTQHQSNQMVFDKLYGDFKKAAKKGNLDPELRDKINMRLASAVDKEGNPVFPPDVDILDKNFKNIANTFDRRSIAGHLMGGVQVGGKKGQIIDYDKIIRETTDPALLDVPSGSLGNRLFTLSGGIIDRPDLHPAFPTILQGEDLGVQFSPVAKDILMRDFIEKTMREKGRKPGYMDFTRGHPPSQLITEDILTEMQKLGLKKGGTVKKAEGGAITGDDLIIEERPL